MNETAKELDFVHTGPHDLAGKYLRMFWQPLYCSHELAAGRAVPIRILGEDLMFPSGRARLATNPLPTGSPTCVITMGNRDSCSLSGTGWRRTSRDNDVYQLGRQRRQAIECSRRVSLLDDDVLTFQISQLSQPLLKSSQRALLNFN